MVWQFEAIDTLRFSAIQTCEPIFTCFCAFTEENNIEIIKIELNKILFIIFFGDIPFLSFNEARIFARSQGLKSNKEWVSLIIRLKRNDLPRTPDYFYKNSGWKGWADFLGKDK